MCRSDYLIVALDNGFVLIT